MYHLFWGKDFKEKEMEFLMEWFCQKIRQSDDDNWAFALLRNKIWVCIHDLACPFLPFLPCLWLMPYYICSSVGKIFHFMLSRIASLVLWSNLLNGHFVITFFLLLSKKYENKIKKLVGLNKALNSCVISAWKSKTKKHDGGPWTKNPGRRARGGGPGAEYRWRTKEEFGQRSPDMGA